jgi:REP element-mobilizing transposase RayT
MNIGTQLINTFYSTYTIIYWYRFFNNPKRVQVIYDAFDFMVKHRAVQIYSFVIMPNHIHVVWSFGNKWDVKTVQKHFRSFTSKKCLDMMSKNEKQKYRVNRRDRVFQFWQDWPMVVHIFSPKFYRQKSNYIHDNPRRKGLVDQNEDYGPCSYRSYLHGKSEFDFLTLN